VRGFFLITPTSETHKHYQSFACLPGAEVGYYVYNHRVGQGIIGAALDSEIREAAVRFRPDFIVYVGACGGNTPSAELFKRLREEIAPTVHFCSDAADDPWWPLLVDYERAGAFSLQVALDGVRDWPLRDTGLSALTPIDPNFYAAVPAPHAERPIVLGFAGQIGARRKRRHNPDVDPRLVLVEQLQQHGLQIRLRSGGPENYREVAEFLGRCRMVPNFAHTGSRRHTHVKGRVVETGLAGATLIEPRDSPTRTWFEPEVEFLEYGSIEEAITIVERLRGRPEETEAMGARLRVRLLREHGLGAFWGRIFDRIGLANPILGAA
jgi:hypothetical protein